MNAINNARLYIDGAGRVIKNNYAPTTPTLPNSAQVTVTVVLK